MTDHKNYCYQCDNEIQVNAFTAQCSECHMYICPECALNLPEWADDHIHYVPVCTHCYEALSKERENQEQQDKDQFEYEVAQEEKASISQSLLALSTAMHKDPEYAWTWHCNLACAGMDAGLGHQAANVMAGNFMKLAFGAEVDKYTPGTKSVEETCEGYVPQPDEAAQGYLHVTTKEQDAEYEAEHHAMEDKMFLETVDALVKEQQSTKTVGAKGKTTSADETAQRGTTA